MGTVIRMRSILSRTVVETTVSKSRFIALLSPVRDADGAAALLDEARRRYPDATHHCHAYVLGEAGDVHRASDDGEPGGTAGTPMLETIRRAGFTDVAVVVVRYFGGIKLGAGGLARAYAGAVRAALAAAHPVDPVRFGTYELTVDAARQGAVGHLLCEVAADVKTTYGECVTFRYRLRERDADGLAARLSRFDGVEPVAVGTDVLYE